MKIFEKKSSDTLNYPLPLPYEVLIYIFSLLDSKYFLNVMLTCRFFHACFEDNFLWKGVLLRENGITWDRLKNIDCKQQVKQIAHINSVKGSYFRLIAQKKRFISWRYFIPFAPSYYNPPSDLLLGYSENIRLTLNELKTNYDNAELLLADLLQQLLMLEMNVKSDGFAEKLTLPEVGANKYYLVNMDLFTHFTQNIISQVIVPIIIILFDLKKLDADRLTNIHKDFYCGAGQQHGIMSDYQKCAMGINYCIFSNLEQQNHPKIAVSILANYHLLVIETFASTSLLYNYLSKLIQACWRQEIDSQGVNNYISIYNGMQRRKSVHDFLENPSDLQVLDQKLITLANLFGNDDTVQKKQVIKFAEILPAMMKYLRKETDVDADKLGPSV